MDDRDFEARLSARLHRRFDGGVPSMELLAGVEQALSTRSRSIDLVTMRHRRQLGWGALIAAGLVAALAFVPGWLGIRLAPGGPSLSPTATPVDGKDRHFIVLPPAGYEPNKTIDTAAADVLSARLRALLFVGDSPNAFTTAVGNAIAFIVPGGGGPSDDSIRAVLRAPGMLSFVPLPDSYADGTHTAVIGQSLPTEEPALFGADGIARATTELDQQGRPLLALTLRPEAAATFGRFTTEHVGATFAIVVDDDVAMLPTVNAPTNDGEIQVSGAGVPDSPEGRAFAESAAIIAGGALPDPWVAPSVPLIQSPEDIVARIEFEFSKVEPSAPPSVDLSITAADLDAILVGRRWTAVWRLGLDGLEAACPSPLPSDEQGICRWTDSTVTHLFDAETGEWLGTAAP